MIGERCVIYYMRFVLLTSFFQIFFLHFNNNEHILSILHGYNDSYYYYMAESVVQIWFIFPNVIPQSWQVIYGDLVTSPSQLHSRILLTFHTDKLRFMIRNATATD